MTVPNWAQRLEALFMPNEQDMAMKLLELFVDCYDGECRFDHNGLCQKHFLNLDDFVCAYPIAKKFVKDMELATQARLRLAGYTGEEA